MTARHRTPAHAPARLGVGLALLACLAGALTAGPAAAATQSSPNACRYSINGMYGEMPVSLTTTAAVLPDARYPSPTDAVPGQTVRTAAGTFDMTLPAYMARFGYGLGLLRAGANTINVTAWMAVGGTNTKERTRVVGPVDFTASTTIDVDSVEGAFISATPFAYTAPVLPQLDWTAVGGDVAVGQAGPGTLPALPVGPGGAPRTPTGSVVVRLAFSGGASLYMDCTPGTVTAIEFDFMGSTFNPVPAAPVTTTPGPRNASCLNQLGRQVTGAAANLPGGLDREIDPAQVSLTTSGHAAQFLPGAPYTLPPARLRALLSADTVATLGRFEDGGSPLVAPDTTYPLSAWVTVAASNTLEGTRTVRVDSSYALHPSGPVTPTTPWDPEEILLDLPATTWTPTGAGPVAFSIAPPGTAATVQAPGPATGGPGGAVVPGEHALSPYGGVVLSLGTARNPTTLDCVTGAVAVANPGVAWSNQGRGPAPAGSAGRYAIDANPAPPVFATALAPAAAPAPAPPAPPVAPAPPPLVPAPVRPAPGRILSSALTVKRGRVAVSVRCTSRAVACRGTLRVRTQAKVRVGARAKVVTVVRALRYVVAPGRAAVLRPVLSADARAALARSPRVRVVVTLVPARGAVVSKRVVLRRA